MTSAVDSREEASSFTVLRAVATYILTHLFQIVALVLTCATALNYAFGRSFLDGWSQAAEVPSTYFR